VDAWWNDAPCGFLTTSNQGVIGRANATVLRWMGLPDDGALGRCFAEFLAPSSRMYYHTVLQPALMMGGEVREVAMDLSRDNGAPFPVFFSARYDAQRVPPTIWMTLVDARERRRYERDLLASNRALESMIEERNRILGMVSHDLRSPLQGLLGLAELLSLQELDERGKEYVTLLASTGTTMLHLVNDLLDAASAELGGAMHIRKVHSDLVASLVQTLLVMEASAKAKGSTLTLVRPEQPLLITHDAARLVQALNNLVGNAIKFSPEGSDVVVSVEEEADDITIVVADRGPGIAADEVEQLFRPFGIGAARPTAGELSSGLGLAIVRRIAEAHDGQVRVRDRSGGGSEFCLKIPRGAVHQ
jgi:signal transduction histidine kinase